MPRRQVLKLRARRLRRDMTDAERALWRTLRFRQIEGRAFRRQHVMGPYIVDFICLDAKLIVEVDGSQHAEREDHDAERTRWLAARGYRVIRFWNYHVLREPLTVAAEIRRVMLGVANGRSTPS